MKIMMFKINLLLILIIPGLLHAQEVMDYNAEYFFETDKFSVSGIRELKTTDNQSSLTFNAKTKLLKLFFESSFDIRNNQVFSDKYSVKLKAFLIKRNYLIQNEILIL